MKSISAIILFIINASVYAVCSTNIDMGNKKIINIADPVLEGDIANKEYIDNLVAEKMLPVSIISSHIMGGDGLSFSMPEDKEMITLMARSYTGVNYPITFPKRKRSQDGEPETIAELLTIISVNTNVERTQIAYITFKFDFNEVTNSVLISDMDIGYRHSNDGGFGSELESRNDHGAYGIRGVIAHN